jgi:hypothetical protein
MYSGSTEMEIQSESSEWAASENGPISKPVLALVGALAVYVTKVKLEVVRDVNPAPDKSKSQ